MVVRGVVAPPPPTPTLASPPTSPGTPSTYVCIIIVVLHRRRRLQSRIASSSSAYRRLPAFSFFLFGRANFRKMGPNQTIAEIFHLAETVVTTATNPFQNNVRWVDGVTKVPPRPKANLHKRVYSIVAAWQPKRSISYSVRANSFCHSLEMARSFRSAFFFRRNAKNNRTFLHSRLVSVRPKCGRICLKIQCRLKQSLI